MSNKAPEIVIEFGRDNCKIRGAIPSFLKRELQVHYPGYMFSKQYKEKRWDGLYKFYTKTGYFPTGLLPLVYCILVTGNNPLKNDDQNPVGVSVKVKILIPSEEKEFFNKPFVMYYIQKFNIVEHMKDEEGIVYLPLPKPRKDETEQVSSL